MPSQLLLSIRIAVLAWFVGFGTAHPQHEQFHDGVPSPYSLVEHYKPKHFFEKFIFYTEGDPTYGFVQYVNHSYAKQNGLIRTFDDHVTIGVDNVNFYDPSGPGRPSVRIQSHKTYTHGLFILDLNQMPYACGAWPAFWTFGPSWPRHGEIDIIEGVNTNNYNLVSLHTDRGCSTAGDNQWGELVTSDCALGNSEQGCGVLAHGKHNDTFGRGFNRQNGGVYAMEWTSSYIRTWHFPRHRIPKSIREGTPTPSHFGKPMANFQGSCDIDKHFKDHTIVFDVTFCGQYAGAVYSQSSCPNAAGGYRACMDFVGNNPRNFTNVQWDINHLKVYQLKGSETSYLTAPPTQLSSVMPLASTINPSKLSSIQIPGGGHTKHVPSHTLSVASSHKSNTPPKTHSSHKASETHHPTSSKATASHHSTASSKATATHHSMPSTKSSTTNHVASTSKATATDTSKTVHQPSQSPKHKPTSSKQTSATAKHSSATGKPSKPSETGPHSTAESSNSHKPTSSKQTSATAKHSSATGKPSKPSETGPHSTAESSNSHKPTLSLNDTSKAGPVPTFSTLTKHRHD